MHIREYNQRLKISIYIFIRKDTHDVRLDKYELIIKRTLIQIIINLLVISVTITL